MDDVRGRPVPASPGYSLASEDKSLIIEFEAAAASAGMTSPHIDIYDDTEVNPPSYLNVAPLQEDEVSNKCSYSLKRSKSVCDFSATQQSLVPAGAEASETSAASGEDANSQKVSKVVRNRTILGSFPLFFKLSQSLSSLNSATTTAPDTTTTSRNSTLCTR